MTKNIVLSILIFCRLAAVSSLAGVREDNSGKRLFGGDESSAIKHIIVCYEPGRFCGWPVRMGEPGI